MIKLKNGKTAGKKSKTLLSALIGFNTSGEKYSAYDKLNKLHRYHSEDVDIISDVSMQKVLTRDSIWWRALNETHFAVATVPVYQCYEEGRIDIVRLLELMHEQAEEGVSVMTIHPTISHELHNLSASRVIPCTSRGGAMVYSDMSNSHSKENIIIKYIDKIAAIASNNKTVLSIGSTFRSASTIDAYDSVYKKELKRQFEISEYLQKKGVSTIIETPGHADADAIESICDILSKRREIIMPLGPMPTDIAFDYDDLAACIGAVLMGTKGCADILAIVTREEHSGGIPSLDSLREAIRKYKVAAHIIDMVKVGDKDEDLKVSTRRKRTESCTGRRGHDCSRCSNACPLRMV